MVDMKDREGPPYTVSKLLRMSTQRLKRLQKEEGVDVNEILFDGEEMPLGGAGDTPAVRRSATRRRLKPV